ncbi:hypothetical protein DSL72_009493 [Monilinia vaccinii-corymbosi]|uniref:Cell cycle control protein n=1 Tax=Monilinia vaccinii-corymbosi TaxID=61207 RepID=A0A8A3PRA0_9HELO|nr:hypothetical protein DSL72_009493 [Monilinia vaccinii-corymbosi]
MENNWSGSRESRKRSLAEISQSHTRAISSSPVLVRERPSNFGSSSSRLPPLANDTAFFPRERRRTPNNNSTSRPSSRPSQSLRAPAEMEANSQPAPLQRRAEFVIDLTSSDQEDTPALAEPPRRANRMHASPRPPPRLERSGAELEQVVDLTVDDDEEDDTIVITHSRERSIPLPRAPRLPPAMPRLLGHFARMDQLGGRATPPTFRAGNDNGNQMEPPRPPPGRPSGGFRTFLENGADIIMDIHNFMGLGRANLGGDERVDIHFLGMPNVMEMDYGRVALQDNKPAFVAPPPVGVGFTRSPTESDTAICPSCEEELIHRKDVEEPVAKKARGAPSKKDREEHPFWVVKDCGHVFCNKCFQNRNNDKIASFRGSKNTLCAVDDCESSVKNKDRWVGIFL